MKLNYRDKVLLGILLAVIIIVAGIFALIKPKITEIKENNVTLEQKLAEKAEIERKIDEIPPLQKDITDIRNETNKLVEDFMTEDMILDARKVDQLMQKYAVENEVIITSLNATDISAGDMNYYYFPKSFVGEEILEEADLKGDIIKQHNDEKAETIALDARNKGKVLMSQYSITVEGDKEHIWNYMKAIEEQDKTMLINSVALNEIELKEDKSKPKDENDKEINPTAQFIITLYSLYELTEPKLD